MEHHSYRALMIVPTLRVGMHPVTLRVTSKADAERPGRRSHAERGNDHYIVALSADAPECPIPEMMGKLFALEAMPLNIDRIRTRVWNTIRTGR
jgi:hypothetical protein